MEFRLIYQGPLLSSGRSNPRAAFKHRLRRHFHKQLENLWKVQQPLSGILNEKFSSTDRSTGVPIQKDWTGLDELTQYFTSKDGVRWVPLINRHYGLVCEIDILLLRPANPGNITTHGGDVDNRIKTLLDALTMPQEIPAKFAATETFDPFFCLMESDALITQLRITVDRLLLPLDQAAQVRCSECGVEVPSHQNPLGPEEEASHSDSDVHAVIHVHPVVADPRRAYIEFSM